MRQHRERRTKNIYTSEEARWFTVTATNPWLSIPLEEYEAHMGSAGVDQLSALAELFKHALKRCLPDSVAVLGVAGGNGLKYIDSTLTKRLVGIDISQTYLNAVQQRFGSMPGLDLHCCDLDQSRLCLGPVALVHAALIFEHTGFDRPLDNALSLVAPGGKLSVVLQLPSEDGNAVACTRYPSIQSLTQGFALIDVNKFRRAMKQRKFHLIDQTSVGVPAGKALWLGIFANTAP